MIRRKSAAPGADVVARLQAQVRDAQALAAIPRQDLLSDPRLNPATRRQADDLTAQRLSVELELEHRRQLRRAREADRVEEEAARAARAVADAEAATDPARSVLELSRSRGRYVAGSLAASFVLSIGSAMGLEAWTQTIWESAPTGIGYLAEVALTGMATAAIAWRGTLARTDTTLSPAMNRLFAGMIAVPLLASIVGSTAGSGPVGAACSIGAALFAWFAYLVSVSAADGMTQAVERMRAHRATVTVEEAPTATTPAPARQEQGEPGVAEEIEDYLRGAPTPSGQGGQEADEPGPGGSGVAVLEHPSNPSGAQGAHPAELEVPTLPTPPGEGVPTVAGEGGQESPMAPTPAAVRAYRHAYPDQPIAAIARHFGLSRRTVGRYLAGGDR